MTYSFRDHLIILELFQEEIESYMGLITASVDNSDVIVSMNDEFIVFNTGQVVELKDLTTIEGNQINILGKGYKLMMTSSDFNMKYYFIYDEIYLANRLTRTNYYTYVLIGMFTLIIFMGAGLAFISLRPIKKLFKIIEIDDQSGQNELVVMEDALMQIKEKQENMEVELSKYYEIHENRILADHIFNNQNDQNLFLENSSFFLLYLIVESNGMTNESYIKTFEEEVLSKYDVHKVVYYMKPKLYVLKDSIRDDLISDIRVFNEKHTGETDCFIGAISKEKEDITLLKEAYEEVQEQINNMEYHSDQVYYLAHEVSPDLSNPKFSIRDESDFVQHVFHGNGEQVKMFLSKMEQHLVGVKYIGAKALYKYLLNIGYIIVSNNPEMSRQHNLDMEKLSKVYDLTFFHQELRSVFLEITSYFNKKEVDIVDKVNGFIGTHYDSINLDLSMISEHVGLTPTYLATYYKKETHQTVKKSIDKVRMEKAKELLVNDKRKPLKVEEVATLVGINSIVTFNRLFKKYMGMTPGQYRMNYSHKELDIKKSE
jgi:YesN/AraC family two-component response regulator